MNQTFDLKNMGFAEMQNAELEVVDGGWFLLGPLTMLDVADFGATVAGVAVGILNKITGNS